jgi:NAD(P)-dependent dehydrogenase (short-subunit alcohol dehydrogenase family)
MKLKDKSAIITGAASGIGREIAVIFAREGARVARADLSKDAADATANEINARGGVAIGVAMDVTNEQAVNDGVAAAVAAFGGVDILISNAGIQIVHPLGGQPRLVHAVAETCSTFSCRSAAIRNAVFNRRTAGVSIGRPEASPTFVRENSKSS